VPVVKVLFVCIGNSCRSQMAEGFARAYGKDVIAAASAGFSPAMMVAPLTKKVMIEKNINLDGQFPKALTELGRESFDVVVNMSGIAFPRQFAGAVREWKVDDPVSATEAVYRRVAAQIEGLVMKLILELRRRT